MKNQIINVDQISHRYIKEVKEEGVMGSIKRLFSGKKQRISALEDISFQINEGEIVGLIGHNGAGKTTLLKVLSGLMLPSQGEVKVLDTDPFQRKNDFLKDIALIAGNKKGLWWDLSPLDSYQLLKTIYGIGDKEYRKVLDRLVPLLKVENLLDVPLRKASLGERMKLEIIGALLHSPKLVFLDEPTIGLDIVARRDIESFLVSYSRESKATLILTSHLIEDIERVCDRIIWLNKGKKVFDGPKEEMAQLLPDKKIVEVKLKEPINSIENSYGELVQHSKLAISFQVKSTQMDKFMNGLYQQVDSDKIVDINIHERMLSDVIHELFVG